LPTKNRKIQLRTVGNVHPTGIALEKTKRQQGFRARGEKVVEGEAARDSGIQKFRNLGIEGILSLLIY
jgi:hypothetical protein